SQVSAAWVFHFFASLRETPASFAQSRKAKKNQRRKESVALQKFATGRDLLSYGDFGRQTTVIKEFDRCRKQQETIKQRQINLSFAGENSTCQSFQKQHESAEASSARPRPEPAITSAIK